MNSDSKVPGMSCVEEKAEEVNEVDVEQDEEEESSWSLESEIGDVLDYWI
jgi:hypothetical protein